MIPDQIKNFTGGMNQDQTYDLHTPSQYYTANNIQHILSATGTTSTISVDDGNTSAFTVPAITTQSQLYVLIVPYTTGNIVFSGVNERTGASEFTGTAQSALANGVLWAADITADINAVITADGGTVTASSAQGSNWLFQVAFSTKSITWFFASTSNIAYITQEGYFGVEAGNLVPFYGIQHLDQLIVFSSKNNDGTQSFYNGVGEIGIVTLPTGTTTYTYKRLARSKQFKFDTSYTFTCKPEGIATGRNGLYFTDNVNSPRVLYYNYATTYTDDWSLIRDSPSFITTDNPNGYYYYNDISNQARLQTSENLAVIDLTSVTTGGALTTGGKRYSVRFYVQDIVASKFSTISNPVPIPLTQEPTFLAKGGNGAQSNYKVTLSISNCNANLYDFIELACLEYDDGAVSGIIVGKYTLSSDAISITHTGNEASSSLNLSEIQDLTKIIKTAKNLNINNQRLFLSNISYISIPDLTDWASTSVVITELVVQKDAIDGFNVAGTDITYNTNKEYYVATNCFYFTGYMPIEEYRFGIEIEFIDGSKVTYFVSDLTFSDNAVEATENDPFGAHPTYINVRAVQAVVDFSTFPLSFSTVRGYRIVRAECVPEVLGNGMSMQAYGVNPEVGYFAVGAPIPFQSNEAVNATTLSAFVCPDHYFGFIDIEPATGDKIYNYGSPRLCQSTSSVVGGNIISLYGYLGAGNSPAGAPQILDVESGEPLGFNQKGTEALDGTLRYSTFIYTGAGTYGGFNQKSVGMRTSAALTYVGGFFPTVNNFYTFYVRPQDNKYGNSNNTQYISCGHYRGITDYSTTVYTDTVYGGDTFVQLHYIKGFYHCENGVPTIARAGIGIYAYSRVNGQMRQTTIPSVPTYPINTSDYVAWINTNLTVSEDLSYNVGYSPVGTAQLLSGFNPDLTQSTILPSTIYYSQPKTTNSLLDLYRVIPPLNFKDFTTSDGQINEVFDKGNQLIVMQQNAIYSQGVNTTAIVSSTDGLPTSLGSGDVLATQAQFITNFGLWQKGAAHRYLSGTGGTAIAWLDSNSKNFLRLSSDGLRILSSENFMQSWFYNNNSRIRSDLDMSMAYDIHKEELLITAKGNYDGVNSANFWWTIVFNERLNAFTTFRSAQPQTYFEFRNFVLSVAYSFSGSSAVNNTVWQHLWTSGVAPARYGIAFVPTVQSIVNKYPEVVKRFMTIWMETNQAPTRLDFSIYVPSTLQLSSSVTNTTTFVPRRDQILALIPNKTADDGRLYSKYLSVLFTLSFTSTTMQKMINFVCKFLPKGRTYNQ